MIINDKSSIDFKTVYDIDETQHPDNEDILCGCILKVFKI